ncbi:hypothetical protein MF672_009550 [Actinomadura sp. ATCC 31491]|uniref:MarR family transcriptional regulator n=1 Tax=Actinomadura luzonensis TaxID=2805427 RepID=A0ABT0FNV2_9ACTN|nr:hypothetical protein [Actinomadura luzonensis]MCK2214031.1 hypothetical protein [Actinomadura luzonensis]
MAMNMTSETSGASVEFHPEGTAGKVWTALKATPSASITAIAEAACVSRPTATKALTAFAEAGHAVRTPGGRSEDGRALPDTWAPIIAHAKSQNDTVTATTDTPTTPDESTVASAVPDAPESAAQEAQATPDRTSAQTPTISLQEAMRILEQEADRRALAEAQLAQAQAEEEARRQQAAEALAKARTVEDTRRALTDLLSAVTTTYAALLSDDETALTKGLEAIYTGTADVRKAARTSQPKTTSTWGSSRGDRSAPRPLRPDVVAHLTKHPDLAFTANEIAKVLGRSSGAVANALDTLARTGEAELVGEGPNRFRAARSQEA